MFAPASALIVSWTTIDVSVVENARAARFALASALIVSWTMIDVCTCGREGGLDKFRGGVVCRAHGARVKAPTRRRGMREQLVAPASAGAWRGGPVRGGWGGRRRGCARARARAARVKSPCRGEEGRAGKDPAAVGARRRGEGICGHVGCA
jgi:hypothetical protein